MINIAVIGGGVNSAVGRAHLSALSMSNSFRITGACFSRNAEVNRETAVSCDLSKDRLFYDYKIMLDRLKDEIDIVLILTPTDQHSEQVQYLIKEGFNVICEKALTNSIDEAMKIKDTLENSKSSLYVIYNYLGYPMVKEMRRLVLSGKIGKVLSVQLEMPQEGYVISKHGKPVVPQKWRLNDEAIPTISLDLGVHLHMMIYYLIGEMPLRTSAISKSMGNFPGIIDDINALVEYSNDVICNMWYSKAASGNRNGQKIRIFGSKGSLKWFQMNPEIINFSDNEGNIQIIDRNSPNSHIANNEKYNRFKGGHPAGFVEALCNYYLDIADELKSGKSSSDLREAFGFKESLEGLQLLHAISLSSSQRCWVDIKNI